SEIRAKPSRDEVKGMLDSRGSTLAVLTQAAPRHHFELRMGDGRIFQACGTCSTLCCHRAARPGDPVRRGLSTQALTPLQYCHRPLLRAMTVVVMAIVVEGA